MTEVRNLQNKKELQEKPNFWVSLFFHKTYTIMGYTTTIKIRG